VVRLIVTGGSLTRRQKRPLRCLLAGTTWQIKEQKCKNNKTANTVFDKNSPYCTIWTLLDCTLQKFSYILKNPAVANTSFSKLYYLGYTKWQKLQIFVSYLVNYYHSALINFTTITYRYFCVFLIIFVLLGYNKLATDTA